MCANYIESVFKNLDPSLFQSTILGVLAIFIPFAIVFLSNILNSKKKRSKFEKMVLSNEVLGAKKIFLFTIISITFFAFFSGTDVPLSAKIASILIILILIYFFWKGFEKILRFSEGDKHKFEISFLKKLNLAKNIWAGNKTKAEKMLRAWSSLWSEKSKSSLSPFNEREFTRVFISHVDDTIKHKKLKTTVELAQTYVGNIEKRDCFLTCHKILPKVFEWNKRFWSEKQLCEDLLVDNNYFGRDFFKAIIKSLPLLEDGYLYSLFSSFKRHIKEIEKKLEKAKDEKEKEKYWRLICNLFANFCPTFFDKMGNVPPYHPVWNDFPEEWKISAANKDNRISQVILSEFLKWSEARIFKNENNKNYDKNLTNVVSGLFPTVHPSLFRAFLMLFFLNEIIEAVEKEPNFNIRGAGKSRAMPAGTSDEKEITQKEETIKIILRFFHDEWPPIIFYRKDLAEDESKNWDNCANDKKQSIVKRIRKEKLGRMKAEIESDAVKKVCGNSEQKESYRRNFLELVQLLLAEIEK